MQRIQLRDIRQVGDRLEDDVDGNGQQISDPNAQQSRERADNAGLCIEDTRNILFPCTQGAEYTDFFGPF
ncbi:hypothetical protein D3C74_486150 [compost metagenome]